MATHILICVFDCLVIVDCHPPHVEYSDCDFISLAGDNYIHYHIVDSQHEFVLLYGSPNLFPSVLKVQSHRFIIVGIHNIY